MDKTTIDLLTNVDKLVIALLEGGVTAISPAQAHVLNGVIAQVRELEKKESLTEEVKQYLKLYRSAIFIVYNVSTLHQLGVISQLERIVTRMKDGE